MSFENWLHRVNRVEPPDLSTDSMDSVEYPPWFPQGRNNYSRLPHTESKARLNPDSPPVSHFQEHREPAGSNLKLRATP